jgi:hypothetical protein
MTEQPPGLLPTGKAPALMRATSQNPRSSEGFKLSRPLDTPTACTERRRQGPDGRCAVGLRPNLDPVACFGAAKQRVEGKKKGRPTLLTGPAPSGMTCGNSMGSVATSVWVQTGCGRTRRRKGSNCYSPLKKVTVDGAKKTDPLSERPAVGGSVLTCRRHSQMGTSREHDRGAVEARGSCLHEYPYPSGRDVAAGAQEHVVPCP